MESKKVEKEVIPFVPIYQNVDFPKNLRKLTTKEKLYFSVIRSQYGVLFLQSKPGVGKSAISKSIAKKMDLQYIDIRLSMADETDMQFPNLTFMEELNTHVIEHAIPEWAVLANERPTLIHFEELNRAPLAVRNAALQILLERAIGPKFKFNDNVYMMSSGNLGEDDSTDVEEFDSALNNRLIHIAHDLTIKEWIDWGTNIIHPDIISFITFYENNFYVQPNDNSNAYATARSWQMLSEYVIANFGGGPKIDESKTVVDIKSKTTHKNSLGKTIKGKVTKREFFKDSDGNVIMYKDGLKFTEGKDNILTFDPVRNWGDMADYVRMVISVARGIVGDTASVAFIRFLEERTKVSLKDIIADYPKVKKELAKFNRDKYSELLTEAKTAQIDKWKEKEVDNYGEFLKECAQDERVGFMLHLIDHATSTYPNGMSTPQVVRLLKKFPEDLKKIKIINKSNKN